MAKARHSASPRCKDAEKPRTKSASRGNFSFR
jgi:hypothetical protein